MGDGMVERARLAQALKAQGHSLGLELVGLVAPDPTGHLPFYREWIEAGRHGEMHYLSRSDAVERRGDLTTTLESVRSVIVVGQGYDQPDPEGVPDDPSRGVIARYARGRDYHKVLKKRLQALGRWLGEEAVQRGLLDRQDDGTPAMEARAYTDTGPILERDLGQRGGLGWHGKNTMLINPERGSYFFLGVLLTDLELPADFAFSKSHCGTCSRCMEACPTGALLGIDERGAPIMDATRCISYLTIELRGAIPEELRPLMGNRIFGCDICQEVCPWNERFSEVSTEADYGAREGLDGPGLVDLAERLLAMDDAAFGEAFQGSPVRRTGRAGLLRNVCVALGNWGAGEGVPALKAAHADPDPAVREHAAWALAQFAAPDELEG